MSSLNETVLLAFRDELCKEAGFADLIAKNKGMLQNAGAAAGVGALGGAALGGVHSGLKNYQEARDSGAGVGSSALHGLAGGLGGAVRGGAAGALAGGIAGGVGARFGGSAGRLTARNDIIGSAARSGQRQVHAVTGMLSPQELHGIRGGSFGAKAGKGQEWAEKAQNMGLTSIPGYLGAMKEHGVGKVLATNAKEQYHNMPKAMAALSVGLPALGVAKTLSSPEDPNGPGKGESVGRNLGGAVGGVMGGVMPVAGNIAMSAAGSAVGGLAGRGIDKLRGRSMKGPVNDLGATAPLEPTESQNTPSERVMSPSAAGQQKDVGL
jgi:hypothetical protein